MSKCEIKKCRWKNGVWRTCIVNVFNVTGYEDDVISKCPCRTCLINSICKKICDDCQDFDQMVVEIENRIRGSL